MLDVVLLIACILIALTAVLYVFYWNQLFALLLSFSIRLFCWTKTGIWIEFGSVHLSLLAGRVLLKNVRYNSSNQTIRAVKCQFNWRYWIRSVAEEEDLAENEGKSPKESLKCRIHISAEGLEWFMYNKTAATESILEHLMSPNPEARRPGTAKSRESTFADVNRMSLEEELVPGNSLVQETHTPNFLERFVTWLRQQMPYFDMENLLPISLDVTKGAIFLGNHTTENLLLAQFASATGTYGIAQSRSKFDIHKQSLRMTFREPSLSLIENNEYWGTTQDIGAEVKDSILKENLQHPKDFLLSLSIAHFAKLWRRARRRFPFFSQHHRRYEYLEKVRKTNRIEVAEEECHVGADFATLEYGADRNLLEAPRLELSYFADVAGPVPEGAQSYVADGLENMDVGNGGFPPEWCIELVLYDAFIRYGPWADRQRTQLQRVFFPPTFQDHEASGQARPGEQRVNTCLKVFVEFRDTTTLHVPFREASKDWQWDGIVDYARNSKLREPASIQIRMGDRTTLKYLVPMVATSSGFISEMELHVNDVLLSSSLNDMVIVDARSLKLSSFLPSPLHWREERTWDFNIELNDTSVNIIRDQINMFADMGRDWSSGPPHDFDVFLPTIYGVSVSLQNGFEINLFANDHNVIDRPSDKQDNTIFTLRGHALHNVISIPMNRFRPIQSVVSFQVDASKITVDLSLPKWNTHIFCPPEQLSQVVQLSKLEINGSYRFFSNVRPDAVEELVLNIGLDDPRIKLLGWAVRHLMVLRENYFGGFTQYSITREYLAKLASTAPAGDPLEQKFRPGKNNAFQVQLSLSASNIVMCIPAGLPGFECCTREGDGPTDCGPGTSAILFEPELLVKLRSNDMGMEMSLNCDPISIFVDNLLFNEDVFHATRWKSSTNRRTIISGLAITANRLFGPPPRNLTYACIWEIQVGNISGVMSAMDGFILSRSLQSFVQGFNDHFNSPDLEFTTSDDRDVTFLRVALAKLDVSWLTDEASARLHLPHGVNVNFNGLAGNQYRNVTTVKIPNLKIQCLLLISSSKRWLETGYLDCGVTVDLYKRPLEWKVDAEKQRAFVDAQDRVTGRICGLEYQNNSGQACNEPTDQKSSMKSVRGWYNALRIQSIFLPIGVEPAAKSSEAHHASLTMPPHRQFRRRSSSNSDSNEDQIIDYDWDAHLAKQRPWGFGTVEEDLDDPSTSIDESDETDASISDDSWMDCFDSDEETEVKVHNSTFYPTRYRHYCKQYALRSTTQESESTFVLEQDADKFRCDVEPSNLDLNMPFRGLPVIVDEALGDGKQYARLAMLREATIFVCPLIIPAVAYLRQSVSRMTLTPELILDGLILKTIHENSSPSLDLELLAPLLRITIVQDLMSFDTFSEMTLSHKTSSSSQTRIGSVIQFQAEQNRVAIGLRSPPKGSILRRKDFGVMEVGKCIFRVGFMSSAPMLKRSSPGELTLTSDVTLVRLRAIRTGRKADVQVERLSTHFNRLAAGNVAATAMQLLGSGKEFVKIINERRGTDRETLQRSLTGILSADGHRPYPDVLSAVQPSFFVQVGRPKELRQDFNWKLLFHLRRTLASMSSIDKEELNHQATLPLSTTDMLEKLQLMRVPWITESEGPTVLDVPIFRTLFDYPDKQNLDGSNTNIRQGAQYSLSFKLKLLDFSYGEFKTSVQNTVSVSNTDLRFDCSSRAMLIPMNSGPSQGSARSDEVYTTLAALATLGVHSVQVAIYPTFIIFLRNAIHAWKILMATPTLQTTPKDQRTISFGRSALKDRLLIGELRFSLDQLLFEAAAENLIFALSTKDLSTMSSVQISKGDSTNARGFDFSGNHSLKLEELSVKARARPGVDPKYDRDDVLATSVLSEASLCVMFRNNGPRGNAVRGTYHMKKMNLGVPRSAIRLYHFFDQWRQDYFLGIETMLRSLFSEIRSNTSRKPVSVQDQRPSPVSIDLQASVSEIAINLRVMHGTWLSWSANEILTFVMGSPKPVKSYEFGLRISSQQIKISTVTSAIDEGKGIPKPTIELHLPSLGTSGTYSSSHVDFIVLVGIFTVMIKPSHWDSLLSVQQKFGQDFNDLLSLVSNSRRRRNQSGSRKVQKADRGTPLSVTMRSEGFRIGVEGVISTQYLECFDVDAVMNNTGVKRWHVIFRNASLYLSSKSSESKPNAVYPLRINVDFEASSTQPTPGQQGMTELSVTRFHAILEPNSISEVSDFIDHLQSEVLLRQEQRAMELDEFKLKAKKVMDTFNTNPRSILSPSSQTVLTGRTIKVSMSNFGVAIPLELTRTFKGYKTNSQHAPPTKAFLISIDLLEFHTHEGERGRFIMKGFSFQFVSRFRQSIKSDFSSCRHRAMNKLIYPEMQAQVHSNSTSKSRKMSIVGDINGFVLDIDPSITGYVFSLVDIYRQGRERVERLAVGLPRSIIDTEVEPSPEQLSTHLPPERRMSSSILATLNFQSGTVRMHQRSNSDSPILSPDVANDSVDEPEIFKLPELSLWAQYCALAQHDDVPNEGRSTNLLIFKATVHSSHNVLRPSLLPFVTEVVQSIEERMKKISTLPFPPSPVTHRSASSTTESLMHLQRPSQRTLEMIFSLQIDQSRLELTCKPDANVVAGLHWDSGGFVVSASPGKEGVSISGTIGGLTTSLKHGFLSDDCANLDARNLNFAINFSKSTLPSKVWINAVSIVVDTEFSGTVRFSRLQDFLVFKAVWLDHIPVFSGEGDDSPVLLTRPTTPSVGDTKQGFDTAILVHIRRIALEADLGQSICAITLDLDSACARTRLTESFSDISISVDKVDISARGNLSGYLRMPNFVFRTIQSRNRRSRDGSRELNNMLELNLTTGTLDAQLQSDWLWLLQYRAEPLEATVYDDWAQTDAEKKENRQLRFLFSVKGTKVLAMMTIMAIPKLIMYAGKLMANLDAQREGASRESSAFRSTRLPKPDNALSQVANAMFQAARSRLKESETLSYAIGQHMALELEELVFVVLPRSQGDNEIARFIGINVMARLDRTVQPDGQPAHRDLRLSLAHMSISQLVKQGFDPRRQTQDFETLTSSARRNTVGNVIFSLPAMDMRMITDDEMQNGLQLLAYDFDSKFIHSDGQKNVDNINISFNLSLYSWLTLLRKNFTRELRRAQEAAEFRNRADASRNNTAPPISTESNASQSTDQRTNSPSTKTASPTRGRSQSSERSPPSTSTANLPKSRTQAYIIDSSTKDTWVDTSSANYLHHDISSGKAADIAIALDTTPKKTGDISYNVRSRRIERLTVKQLGEATPDVMHPFFMKKAGFNLEESLPQFVHEYATLPIEQIMKVLLKLYSKQLRSTS